MKKYILIVSFIFNWASNAQSKSIDSLKMKHFKFETGILIPLDNLKSKIGVSTVFGFWYRNRFENNDLLDLGLQISIPNVKNSFEFKGKDSTFQVRAKGFEFKLGTRVNKVYNLNLTSKKTNLEWSSGFGVSVFMFEDKENPEDSSGYFTDKDGKRSYNVDTNTKGLTSLYLSQGIGFTTQNFGFNLVYNFIPYNWFSKRIESDFGKSSLFVTSSFNF